MTIKPASEASSPLRAWTAKQWNTGVQWIITNAKKMDEKIHEMGVQAMLHASLHRDVSRMVQLVEILGKTTRVAGFLVWVEKYSPIRMKRDGSEARIGRKQGSKEDVSPFDVDTAHARPFWTLKEADEKTSKPLSAEAFLAMIQRFGKQIDNAQSGKSNAEIEGDAAFLKRLSERVYAAAQEIVRDAPKVTELTTDTNGIAVVQHVHQTQADVQALAPALEQVPSDDQLGHA